MTRKRTVHEVAFRLSFDMHTLMAGKVGNSGVELTPLKMRTMRVIWAADDVTAQDIVQVLKRDKAQVARMIEDLVAQKLVRRDTNPKDRRSKLLHLTARGEKIFETVEQVERSFSSDLVKGIKKTDLETFYKVADAISENLKSLY